MARRPLPLTRPSADEPPRLLALLGPTNTGKTHRALTRMLRHDTGMIGLPLRLLAREVYDRLTLEVGESAVALVTGEERRIPARPRFWACTVEAMPAHPVDFLAVDEVQLAADPARGHVFTNRLLHARGLRETVFLGSDTMEPLLRRLLPGLEVEARPRLSRLTHAGHRGLRGLPPRSAVIGFSAERVYALAERVRQRTGGAAVVLGALSPRTRNAQVAMFQAGEVGTLVATDAIGMGLNLDVSHVAFAELDKYDGSKVRRLTAAELGQIAGRAGRHLADGTFGTTDSADPLAPGVAEAVSAQHFPEQRRLYWRAAAVDTSSVEALRRTLRAPPPLPFLQRCEPDEDEAALDALTAHPELAARLGSADAVALLWEVCRVPDFRKGRPEHHHGLLQRLFLRLLEHGALSPGWAEEQVHRLDRIDGEVDDLTTRLAFVRTWSYVGWRPGWLPPGFREQAQSVENRLSDALHARLVERFVDRRASVGGAGGARLEGDRIRVGGAVVGRLAGLVLAPEGGERGEVSAVPASLRGALVEAVVANAERLVEARSDEIVVGHDLLVRWEGHPVARLGGGPDVREPVVTLLRSDLLPAGARTQVERRLSAWARDHVSALLAPLRDPEAPRGPVRGLLYAMEKHLGNVPAAEVRDLLEALRGPDRAALARLGVRVGVRQVYAAPLLEAAPARAVLWAAWRGVSVPPIPTGLAPPSAGPPEAWPYLGYVAAGPRLLRMDEAERIGALLRQLARGGAFAAPPELALMLGTDLPGVLAAGGYRATRSPDGTERWSVRR